MMRPLKVTSCHIIEPNPQSCCQVMVEGSTQLVPPALRDEPIVHKNTVHAQIEKVCAESVIISGFIRRTISYTSVLDNGIEQEKEIVDDIPFQCVIDREDANKGDEFRIVGVTILCEVFAEIQNFKTHPLTDRPLAYKFVEKDIVKVCIRKGCKSDMKSHR